MANRLAPSTTHRRIHDCDEIVHVFEPFLLHKVSIRGNVKAFCGARICPDSEEDERKLRHLAS